MGRDDLTISDCPVEEVRVATADTEQWGLVTLDAGGQGGGQAIGSAAVMLNDDIETCDGHMTWLRSVSRLTTFLHVDKQDILEDRLKREDLLEL